MNDDRHIVLFIRHILSVFLLYHEERRPWNKATIANHITVSESIGGTITASTIGRFLEGKDKRVPLESTVRMLSEFLIEQHVITQKHIEALSFPHKLRSLFNVSDFFAKEHAAKIDEFLNEFSRDYHFVSKQDDLCLEGILTFQQVEGLHTLMVTEILLLSSLITLNGKPARKYIRALSSEGALVGVPDILSILLRADCEDMHSVMNIHFLGYDEDDAFISELKTNRNIGWDAGTEGDIPPIKRIVPNSSSSQIIKLLSQNVFYKTFASKKDVDLYKETVVLPFKSTHSFSGMQHKEKVVALDENKTLLDSRFNKGEMPRNEHDLALLNAMELADISLFTQAIENGADHNLLHPKTNEPIVLYLAQNLFAPEWFEVLFTSGECKMTVYDANGFLPSFHFARAIDNMKRFNHPVESVLESARDIIDAEQNRQFVALGRNPDSEFPSPSS